MPPLSRQLWLGYAYPLTLARRYTGRTSKVEAKQGGERPPNTGARNDPFRATWAKADFRLSSPSRLRRGTGLGAYALDTGR
jgi:hypothetical protein